MIELLQQLIDAASLGGLYALFALGIAVIFGVARIVNFAHGELIMVGGYTMLIVVGLPWPLVLLATVTAVVLLALLLQRALFRPLRDAPIGAVMVGGFAALVIIQNTVIVLAGSRAKSIDFGAGLIHPVTVGPLRASPADLVAIVLTATLLMALVVFLRRVQAGIELRAAAEDFLMARLLGVRAEKVVTVAFVISGFVAAASAVILVIQTGTLSPDLGLQPLLVAFVATVIGGLGSLSGAVLGGFLLGVTTVMIQITLPDNVQPYRDAVVFSVVIATLLLRPQGLLPGPGVKERV